MDSTAQKIANISFCRIFWRYCHTSSDYFVYSSISAHYFARFG